MHICKVRACVRAMLTVISLSGNPHPLLTPRAAHFSNVREQKGGEEEGREGGWNAEMRF
jgi:hypothetical protein